MRTIRITPITDLPASIDPNGGDHVFLTRDGEARHVILSVKEYRRIMLAAGEKLPTTPKIRTSRTIRSRPDPLGLPTDDLACSIRAMADLLGAKVAQRSIRAEVKIARELIDASDRHGRRPPLLILDRSPLTMLALLDRLDWLFAPGGEVWLSDVVSHEATAENPEQPHVVMGPRSMILCWLSFERGRIKVFDTNQYRDHTQALSLWVFAQRPNQLRPRWRQSKQMHVVDALEQARQRLGEGERTIAVADDIEIRHALRVLGEANVAVMSSASYLTLLADEFEIEQASKPWERLLDQAAIAPGAVPA